MSDKFTEKTIFEYSVPGRKAVWLPELDVPEKPIQELIPKEMLRSGMDLPQVSEVSLVRHFTHLSQRNYGVDTGFYPLGSCTMKYNPKVNERVAGDPGFTGIHPLQAEETTQGALRLLWETERFLAEIGGMDAVTLQPAAGAQGESTAILMVRAYLEKIGQGKRHIILVPDSAHGTNPATAARSGFEIVKLQSNERDRVDLAALDRLMSDDVAALMLTNPNTLGLFEDEILEISRIVHERGGLMYCDGANMNAILGKARPGDMGFDLMHFNLHKTFSTPHGGGGPGSGPVAVKAHLAPFLPVPRVERDGEVYRYSYDRPDSIGKVQSFYGNFDVIVRAYAYIRSLGPAGLTRVAERAVLNANYLLGKLAKTYEIANGKRCMHEFVLSAVHQKNENGVRALDIAKRLMDYGFHPPTIYFPLIVEEAMMIEPTETETLETLDSFAAAMLRIAQEAEDNPEIVRSAPHETLVRRPDEVKAARQPVLRFREKQSVGK